MQSPKQAADEIARRMADGGEDKWVGIRLALMDEFVRHLNMPADPAERPEDHLVTALRNWAIFLDAVQCDLSTRWDCPAWSIRDP
jgi:hypothetical protein